jgi:uncharacterized protein with HEPN domain
MRRRDDLLLIDIVVAADRIASYLDRQTKETFLLDLMRRDAVLTQLLVIGEAAVRIPPPIRNRAIHAYGAVDWDIVWNAVTVNVPLLVSQITAVLANEYPSPEQTESEPTDE